MRSEVPSEHYEQVCYVNWFELNYPDILIYAIPNGGKRHPATARKLKQEGVRSGIPDLHVPAENLWVEMKRVRGGTVSASQKERIDYLESIGHTVLIAKGFEDAVEKTQEFMRTIGR